MKELARILRTLEIKESHAATWEALTKEKWLNLGKTSELCGVLICPNPIPCSPATQ